MVADTVQKILDVEMTWKINEDGKIEAVIEAVKDKEFPDSAKVWNSDVFE